MDHTFLNSSSLPSISHPFYDIRQPSLIPHVQDRLLALIAPILAYWLASFFFHLIDVYDPVSIRKFRIHEPQEVTKRNKVTPSEVIWAVLMQQALQTVLGMAVMESTETSLAQVYRDDVSQILRIQPYVAKAANVILGSRVAESVIPQATEFMYWWGIPAAQFLVAMLVMDTWQYWLHRWAHTNKWLYKTFHSVHHRLYVPYAYGALYNHPVEGFVLDSVGAVLAHSAAFLSTRQTVLFFAFASFKTCNDHASHRLPWNPLNIFPNDAVFHNYHHQNEFIKYNFSQPFFIHMDKWFGTMLTDQELDRRAQAKLERKKTS